VGLLAAGLVAGGIVALILTRGGNRRNPGAGGESSGARSEAGRAAARPNIVFVLTDDLSVNLVQFMPHVLAMERAGLTFEDYFVSDSLCCPSRASIFTGDFPHDTGVFSNFGPGGGFRAFYRHGNERHTFPLGMQRAGYATALMGKFLNGYLESSGHGHVSDGEVTNVPARYVPPGFTDWDVAGWGYPEFNYTLNQDGVLHYYGGSSRRPSSNDSTAGSPASNGATAHDGAGRRARLRVNRGTVTVGLPGPLYA